jgi:anti-anti-sigma regulatory factor
MSFSATASEELAAARKALDLIVRRVRRFIEAGLLVGDPIDISHVLFALARGLAVQEASGEVLRDALERALDADRLYVIVDLDRCTSIDIVAVKLLVVAHAHHSSRGEEFLIFGATDLVRRRIEGIHAFDDRVLLPTTSGR